MKELTIHMYNLEGEDREPLIAALCVHLVLEGLEITVC